MFAVLYGSMIPRLFRGREAVAGRAPDDVGARIVLLRAHVVA